MQTKFNMGGTNILVLSITVLWILTNCVFASCQGVEPAPGCTNETECLLPDCRCSSTDIPGNLPVAVTPQLVFLTFEDSVNIHYNHIFQDILDGRKNPNNHSITATFFTSHEFTNYSTVHELWRNGHEIALNSISRSPDVQYWLKINETMWIKEVAEQREQMAYFAEIPTEDIIGFRVPLLQGGGDTMFKVMNNAGLHWDCSRPTLMYRNPAMWPYTNDYASTQECSIEPCPVGAYHGFWTVPMIEMIGNNGEACKMMSSCKPVPVTADEVFDLLSRNFQDHYNGNRAPFGIFTYSMYFEYSGGSERIEGMKRFLDYLATKVDVYIVSISRGLEWIKYPTPVEELYGFSPFKVDVKASHCPTTFSCLYPPDEIPWPYEKWLHSCKECPPYYPELGNHLGQNPYP